MKACTKGSIEALTNFKKTKHSKLIEENQYYQHKIYSVFEGLQDGSEQKSVAFMLYDLAIG